MDIAFFPHKFISDYEDNQDGQKKDKEFKIKSLKDKVELNQDVYAAKTGLTNSILDSCMVSWSLLSIVIMMFLLWGLSPYHLLHFNVAQNDFSLSKVAKSTVINKINIIHQNLLKLKKLFPFPKLDAIQH